MVFPRLMALFGHSITVLVRPKASSLAYAERGPAQVSMCDWPLDLRAAVVILCDVPPDCARCRRDADRDGVCAVLQRDPGRPPC